MEGPFEARWVDGLQARWQPVWLHWDADHLHLSAREDAAPVQHPLRLIRVSEQFEDDALALRLPDGSTLELPADSPAIPALRSALGSRTGLAVWLMARWSTTLCCLVCLVVTVVWLERQGIGMAAQQAMRVLPREVDRAIGDAALRRIEQDWLSPSGLPEARRLGLDSRFMAVATRLEPGLTVRLSFHRLKKDAGFNAFALPQGHIVVLDGLAEALTDDELLGVLGHELAHVVYRHGLDQSLRKMGVLALAGMVLGDVSSLAGVGAAAASGLRYSREAESDADAYALRFLAEAGLKPAVMSSVWRKFMVLEQATESGQNTPEWLRSHPRTEDRLRKVPH